MELRFLGKLQCQELLFRGIATGHHGQSSKSRNPMIAVHDHVPRLNIYEGVQGPHFSCSMPTPSDMCTMQQLVVGDQGQGTIARRVPSETMWQVQVNDLDCISIGRWHR